MKKILILLLVIFTAASLKAQGSFSEKRNISFLKAEKKDERTFTIKRFKNTLIKNIKKPAAFHFLNRAFRPKVSVDLLEGSGIHLFTISDIGPLPTLNIGARFKAGIIITI